MRIAPTMITAVLAGCSGITNLGDGPPPDAKVVDVKAIFSPWSGCMTLTSFQAASMASTWGTLTTNNGKQCQNCHGFGEYGFIATDDEPMFFSTVTERSAFMAKYFTVDFATEKVVVNIQSFISANSKPDHPKFNPTMNAGMTALETFYAATVANTACDPPRMID